MITDKTKAMVATLYREGLTIAEICKRTGIRSSATIYNIVTELGIKGEKGKKRGTFSVVLTLPVELREWVEEQGDELSKLVSNLIYSRVEGLGEAKNPNLGSKVEYSRVEALGEPKKSNLGSDLRYSGSDPLGGHQISNLESDLQYSRVEPLGEDKERISDIKTISHNSQSEGEYEVGVDTADPSYTKDGGKTIIAQFIGDKKSAKGWELDMQIEGKENEPLVKMEVVFFSNGSPIMSTNVTSYVDEQLVAHIATALWVHYADETDGADEVAVYNEGQLLWMWNISDLR